LKQRTERAMKNDKIPAMVAFPEGTTTNGETLLEFKRGAFCALSKIKPLFMEYSGPFFYPHYCILPMKYHLFIQFSQILTYMTVYELPIIYPTEYMFKNWNINKREDKSLIYADVVREIYSETFKRPKSPLNFHDLKELYQMVFEQKMKVE
jgi:lysophosphatidylcholine acyltransferase / lyso-PAF acetyltransferase